MWEYIGNGRFYKVNNEILDYLESEVEKFVAKTGIIPDCCILNNDLCDKLEVLTGIRIDKSSEFTAKFQGISVYRGDGERSVYFYNRGICLENLSTPKMDT